MIGPEKQTIFTCNKCEHLQSYCIPDSNGYGGCKYQLNCKSKDVMGKDLIGYVNAMYEDIKSPKWCPYLC